MIDLYELQDEVLKQRLVITVEDGAVYAYNTRLEWVRLGSLINVVKADNTQED